MDPKEYYRTYLADNNLSELSSKVIELIRIERPVHALEFGGGTGKHIRALEGIAGVSLDISFLNIAKAHLHNDLGYQIHGDEGMLRHICNFDIVFTVSVLDHIENVSAIITEFKRIANRSVYLAEALADDPERFYYPHKYSEWGFDRLDFSWTGADGFQYGIWRFSHNRKGTAHDDMG